MDDTTVVSQECDVKCYEVTAEDLPIACPMPNTALWNAHPRVYLPMEKPGKVSCPYCGTTYILK